MQQRSTWLRVHNFGSLYCAEVFRSPCYLSSHLSVNTTGVQLYPLPSLRKRPKGGKNDECGTAIKTSSLASLGSNCCRVAAAAVWSMSKIAVTSGCCNWTRCAWTMSPQNRIVCPFDENS